MIDRDKATRAAARNNAEWCDSMCRAHGIPGRFDADAWVNPQRTPRYYPDAVSLDPSAAAGSILDRIDTASPGCSIKDSFATLDLTQSGFRIVRDAEWLYRASPTAPNTGVRGLLWAVIATPEELIAWEAAWDADAAHEHLFLPALLGDSTVSVLAGFVEGSIVAGAIANRTGQELVGLSNVFAVDADLDDAWRGSLAYLDATFPGLAVVGYGAGQDLSIAHRQGFVSVGALRIWLRES